MDVKPSPCTQVFRSRAPNTFLNGKQPDRRGSTGLDPQLCSRSLRRCRFQRLSGCAEHLGPLHL